MKTLAAEPPIKPGAPDPYQPPIPRELRPEEHIQLGVITQFVTTLVKSHEQAPPPHTGFDPPIGMRDHELLGIVGIGPVTVKLIRDAVN